MLDQLTESICREALHNVNKKSPEDPDKFFKWLNSSEKFKKRWDHAWSHFNKIILQKDLAITEITSALFVSECHDVFSEYVSRNERR